MPFAVYSNTGGPFRIEGGVLLPSEPQVVDELTEEMEFQRVNLRVVELDGDGNELPPPPPPPPSVPHDEHEKALRSRERYKDKAEKLEDEVKRLTAELAKATKAVKAEPAKADQPTGDKPK